ncbi:MAG: 3-hydroxyacyl-CoA dehydrogenase NAD-binding domain-containing protein [Candidatus Marinamargulisbacteria bacterium]
MNHIKLTFHDIFAYVTFDMVGEKVNKFNREMMIELTNVIQQVNQHPKVQWVLFDSLKAGVFIAGADIKELRDVKSMDDGRALIERGQTLFNQLADMKAKTVALVDGVALGGGLEFSLACDYIVVTNSDKVRLGLPEVNLGIIPGWGGTQRLPKRIGLIKGVEHIVTGKAVNAKKALKLGLADAMVPSAFKHDALMGLIKANKLKRKKPAKLLVERIPGFGLLLKRKVRQSIIQKTNGHYPAPLKALDVVMKTHSKSVKKGLAVEFEGVVDMFETSIPKNLMSLFFSQENVKKSPILTKASDRKINQVGVVGAGLMGGGIAWWFINNQQFVRLKDISWDMVRKGYQSAASVVKKGVKRRKLSKNQGAYMLDQITSTLEYDGFQTMDLVIEAVPEKMGIKKDVLKDIEASVSDRTIIATNTSSLSIDEMASALKQPERFLGIHFFSPVHKMPLVEIIPSEKTSEDVIADACKMVLKNKKFPIVVKNCPGFLINRILLPYVNEAIHLMVQGFKVDDIDAVATAFGMPLGPLALADEVGLDIGLHVLSILEDGYGSRMAVPDQLKGLVTDDQLLGKKTKKGFYIYANGTPQANYDIYKSNSIVMKYRISDQDRSEIIDRLILIMVNEAARCLDEGIVESAEMLDLAMIMGTGFPPFRGGLLKYSDERGIGEIVHRLNHLAQTVDQRFKPCGYLLKMGQDNLTFYR